MQNNVKRSNAGFSLVELLVIVAIMGILMGGSIITWYTVSSTNVKKAAGYIGDAMTECRNRAMTTAAESWEVVVTREQVTVIKTESGGTQQVMYASELPKNVAVSFQQEGMAVVYDLFDETTGYDSITISYKLLSGEVNTIVGEIDDVVYELYTGAESSTYCDIVCDYNNKRTYTMRLYYSTGKYIEQ